MQPIQKAIIMSISSVFGLYKDMHLKGAKFILTARLNQDALESTFSQIRRIGHFYDHPSLRKFMSRLKHILLANKILNLSEKVNSISEEYNNIQTYLTAKLLKETFNENNKKEIIYNQEDLEDILKICEIRKIGIISCKTIQNQLLKPNKLLNTLLGI